MAGRRAFARATRLLARKEEVEDTGGFFGEYRRQVQGQQSSVQSGGEESERLRESLREAVRATRKQDRSESEDEARAETSSGQSKAEHGARSSSSSSSTESGEAQGKARVDAIVEAYRKAKEAVKTTSAIIGDRAKGFVPASASEPMTRAAEAFREEARFLMMSPAEAAEARQARKREKGQFAQAASQPISEEKATGPESDETALVAVMPKEGFWDRQRRRFERIPGAKRVTRAMGMAAERGKSAAEGVYEKMETSDSRVAHKLLDSYDYLRNTAVEENAQAQSLRRIRERQPDFSVDAALGTFQRELPKVLEAYLAGDERKLQESICSKEMLERLSGEARYWASQGLKMDSRVLSVADMELVEAKEVDDEPCLVVRFVAQQINCMRRLSGEVVEGAPDDIRAVHYVCAMEHTMSPRQPPPDFPERAGPSWQLRELAIQGMERLTS